MYEEGIVKEVKKDTVSVICGTPESCAGCKSPLCSKRDRIFEVRNDEKINLKSGDKVEILFPAGKTIFASFMVLIFPLILFAVFYFIGDKFFGFESELKKVLCGIIGIANGFLIAFIYGKIRRNKDIPVITNKI